MPIQNYHNIEGREPKNLYRVDYKPFDKEDEDGSVHIIAENTREASEIFLSFYSCGVPNPKNIPSTIPNEVNERIGERSVSTIEKMAITKVSHVVLIKVR